MNAPLTPAPVVVPDSLLAKLPTVGAELSAPMLARAPAGKTSYLLPGDGTRRAVHDSKAEAGLLAALKLSAVQTLPASALVQLDLKGPVYAPATLLQASTGTYFITDGLSGVRPVANPTIGKLYGFSTVVKLGSKDLAAYGKLPSWSGPKLLCGGVQYLPVSGKWQPMQCCM